MWTVHTKNRFLPQKNKNGGRFRIHEWDMREKFVNILRFLPLRTIMALAQSIMEVDL